MNQFEPAYCYTWNKAI